ncbi:MAG TPA: hypothetical protein VHD36_13625 [Pirellulales bacterium]|nr:hypothetical protein [Pirellulales bacterium]
MAPEEAVYICSWSQTEEGFEVWIKSRPDVRASGPTSDAAIETFLEVIIKRGGAYHAVLEFVPPLPESDFDRRYSQPAIVALGSNDGYETDEPKRIPFEPPEEREVRESWYDGFFKAPCCRTCGTPQGPRNQRPLHLTYARNDAGSLWFQGARLRVFSEDFLMMLSGEEHRHLTFQPVERNKRSRKRYFELLGPSGAPNVAIRGLDFSGWQCGSCGTRCFGYWSEAASMIHFVARADLPDPLPEVFTIGPLHDLELCVTAERWSRMVGQRGTRGMVSLPIGVVPDEEVEREPELPPREV